MFSKAPFTAPAAVSRKKKRPASSMAEDAEPVVDPSGGKRAPRPYESDANYVETSMRTTGQHPWAVVLMQSAATVVMLGTLCYLQSMHWHTKRESARLQLCSNVVTANDAAVTLPPACT